MFSGLDSFAKIRLLCPSIFLPDIFIKYLAAIGISVHKIYPSGRKTVGKTRLFPTIVSVGNTFGSQCKKNSDAREVKSIYCKTTKNALP